MISIKGTYNRAYCWGERLSGPLQLSGANDNLDDATDLFMSFTLLDGNGNQTPITRGTASFSLVRAGWDTWGNDIKTTDTIPDALERSVMMEEFINGSYEVNLSQIMRDEGLSGQNTIYLRFRFHEKTDSLRPGNNLGCADTTGYGTGVATWQVKEIKLKTYNISQ